MYSLALMLTSPSVHSTVVEPSKTFFIPPSNESVPGVYEECHHVA
jgi:hypothetical protein